MAALACAWLLFMPAQLDVPPADSPPAPAPVTVLEELDPGPASAPAPSSVPAAEAPPPRKASSTRARLLPVAWAVGSGMAGAAAGGALGLLVGALLPAAAFTAFMALAARRQGPRDAAFNPGSFFVDASLYGLLFALAGSPVVLAAAGAGDAAGFTLGALLGARVDVRRMLVGVAVGALVAIPAALALLVGTGALAAWLGMASLPDVLMFPAFAGLALSAVLLVAGALMFRPALHAALLAVDALLR